MAVIFIQGTMSNVGKSMIAAGLCRVFTQDGYRVAPFKSQNMANNSFVTAEGLEMGRAQVMQAECASVLPEVAMNPILLKPTDDVGSQVIVCGRPVGNMKAAEYFEYKKSLIPVIKEAYSSLSERFDIIVVEGAGSPAEINLKDNDIVNMGLADMIDSKVLLVGDIDRGGVFAQLIGTLDLLTENERARVAGLVINKFRGDTSLLTPGIRMLEEKARCPVLGVVPFADLDLDDEDSLSERFAAGKPGKIDIAVIRHPYIANFTDLDVFGQSADVSVRYVNTPEKLGKPDAIVLPGSKNTISDMKHLVASRLADAIKDHASSGGVVIGICGGYQMLGISISDPDGAEGGGSVEGLSLLPVRTVIGKDKIRRSYRGCLSSPSGVFSHLKGCTVEGYEIHMGITSPAGEVSEFTANQTGYCLGNVYGSYVHGLFDTKEMAEGVLTALASRRGITVDTSHITDQGSYRQRQYDKLAGIIRQSLDMDRIYEIMGIVKDEQVRAV